MVAVARLLPNGDLVIKGQLHTQWPAFDDTDDVDDQRTLDDMFSLNDESGAEALFEYLLGISSAQTAVTKTFIDFRGNLVTPQVLESQTNTTFRSTGISLQGELIEEGI